MPLEESAALMMAGLNTHPRKSLGHFPTPLEPMANLAHEIHARGLHVKRDDCTGLAFGGNKVRQLEFYLGKALAEEADTVLITGAVQSNFVRTTVAAASKLGLECHVQLEERVKEVDELYRNSGNVLLDRLLGAHVYHYPEGEDEAGADKRVRDIAAELADAGRKPFVIPLSPGHPPLGALGYVAAAGEILEQIEGLDEPIDEVVVASGSGHTHAGLLFGMRANASPIPVTGVCVRRDAAAQRPRVYERCNEIAALLSMASPVTMSDIVLVDKFLAPGYGQLNPATVEAISTVARLQGILLDPVYTGKAMAGFLHRAKATRGSLLFVHTGGVPAIFAYEATMRESLDL